MKFVGTTKELPDMITMLPLDCLGSNLKKNDVEYFQRQVQKLPREEALSLCAKLNMLCFDGVFAEDRQENVLRLLCRQQWLDEADVKKMQRYVERRGETFNTNPFFSRISCLELMRWLSVWGNPADTGIPNDMHRKHGFARSMLMAFEFWSARTQMRIWSPDSFDELEDEVKLFESLRVFREASLWQVPTFNPQWQFGRSYELFVDLFFGCNPELRTHVENSLGMSLEDYITCIIGFYSLRFEWFDRKAGIVDNFEFDPTRVYENTPHLKATVEKFLQLETRAAGELEQVYKSSSSSPNELTNLLPLRERPILLIDGSRRATFIDFSFLIERASNGLLFRTSKIPGGEAMKLFGEAFEEWYSATLRKHGLNVTSYARVNAVSHKKGKPDEFTDYVMLCGRTLILIEMKGKWLQDNAVGKLTAEEYWNEIKAKYVLLEEAGKKPDRKGVQQLAEAINGWFEGRLIPDIALSLDDFDVVIPVLLVYDAHLPALSHGTFLAKELQPLIDRTSTLQSNMRLAGKEILHLCLISMDDFEGFENRILRRDLSDVLLEYSRIHPFRHVSAGSFLSHIESEKFCPQPPIVGEAEAALDKATLRLFGRPLPD